MNGPARLPGDSDSPRVDGSQADDSCADDSRAAGQSSAGDESGSHEDRVDAVIADYFVRVDRGEYVDVQALLSAHPDLAADLREFFGSTGLIEQFIGIPHPDQTSRTVHGARRRTVDPSSLSTADGSGTDGGQSRSDHADADVARRSHGLTGSRLSALSSQPSTGSRPSATGPEYNLRHDELPVPSWLGRYHLERIIGRGAMGVVYLAHDSQLHRDVALKVPRFEVDGSPDVLMQRFFREARSAAGLRHSRICPVYDTDEVDGVHFITMAYIDGRTLSQTLRDGGRFESHDAAALVMKVAEGLAQAHARGVIHRDVKPGNIMIDRDGEPVVMDFGLAARLDVEDPRVTQHGTLLGTPAYMSPEHLSSNRDAVGPASDVFSLGVILYELLAGRLPFRGSIVSIAHQIANEDPVPIGAIQPQIDPALEAICLRMLARKPADRTASMQQVVSQLADWLRQGGSSAPGSEQIETSPTGLEPVGSGPAALPELDTTEVAHKPGTDRHKVGGGQSVVPSTARHRTTQQRVTAAFLIVGLIVAVAGFAHVRRDLPWPFAMVNAPSQPTLPDDETHLRNVASNDVPTAGEPSNNRVASGEPGPGSEIVAPHTNDEVETFERSLNPPVSPPVAAMALAANGFLATVDTDQQATIRDRSGAIVNRMLLESPADALALSDDGRWLASSFGDCVTIHSVTGSNEVFLTEAAGAAADIAFSPDGRLLAMSGDRGELRIWNVAEHKLERSFQPVPYELQCVRFSPDGRYVYSGEVKSGRGSPARRTLKQWNVATGELIRIFDGTTGNVRKLDVSPDGWKLATGNDDGTILVHDLDSGRLLYQLAAGGAVDDVQFSADGRWLAAVGVGTLRFWEAASGRPVFERSSPDHVPDRFCLASDNHSVITLQRGRSVRLWNSIGLDLAAESDSGRVAEADSPSVPTVQPLASFRGHIAEVRDVLFEVDGTHAWSAGDDGTIRRWDVAGGREVLLIRIPAGPVRDIALSPDERFIASAHADGSVEVREIDSGQVLHHLQAHQNHTDVVAWSPGGELLATGGRDGVVRLWDSHDGSRLLELQSDYVATWTLHFLPDNLLMASGERRGFVWELPSGRLVRALGNGRDLYFGAQPTPDGRLAVFGNYDGEAGVWTLTGPLRETPLARHDGFVALHKAVLSDGRRVVTGGTETVQISNMSSLQPVSRFRPDRHGVGVLSVSPDDRFLLLTGRTRTGFEDTDYALHLFEIPEP